MKWSNGKHAYKGKNNDRGKRKASKVFKGMKVDKKDLKNAYKILEEEMQFNQQ